MSEQVISQTINCPEKEPSSDTDSSITPNEGSKIGRIPSPKNNKKRIGPYSYRLDGAIGSGFSSIVYKGSSDSDKSQPVAIKVVSLRKMKPHRRHLLENEIRILKKIDHPNLLAFKDVYFTENNCYIVTQFCSGGSLQKVLTANQNFDWRKAAYEVSIGCQELARLNIVHRDIKPSNVLLNNGVFKICDFGFSIQFDRNQQIKQDYVIGSPLYMPPESLCDNLYSSKTDSFALGVLLYFLVAKRFPWKGKNKNDLVDNLKKKKYSKSGIVHLPPRVKHLISGLIEIDSAKRIPLIDCDFEVFLHLGPPVIKIEDQLHRLRPCYTEQLQLCQYINSILKNFDEFTWTNSFLKEFIVRHLSSLTFAFEWQNQSGLNSIRKSYSLPEEDPHFHSDEYYWLNNCLKDTIKVLTAQFEPSAHIMLQKLLQYQQIIEAFLFESHELIITRTKELILHSNFSLVRPNQIFIARGLGKIDFYEL